MTPAGLLHGEPPLVLPVVPSLLRRANPWFVLLAERSRAARSKLRAQATRFAFKSDEKAFVLDVLRRKPNVALYRCDQQGACGDFVLVDLSSPDPARRRVVVVELKRAGGLHVGGGGAGVQLRNAALAVEAVAATGAVAPGIRYELVTGSRAAVLEYLDGPPRTRSRRP